MAIVRLLPADYDHALSLCLEDLNLTGPEMSKALLHFSATLERLQLHRCQLRFSGLGGNNSKGK